MVDKILPVLHIVSLVSTDLLLHGVPAVPSLLHMDAAVDGQVGLGAPTVTVPGDGAQAGVHPQQDRAEERDQIETQFYNLELVQ